MTDVLPIVYQDEHLVAVNKPSGLLVHRSAIDRHETRFALQLLRDQLGQHVYPVHRLDKPTSGVLVFALSAAVARQLGDYFYRQRVEKTYLAVVRGNAPQSGIIDHPLREEQDACMPGTVKKDKQPQSAITHFRCLANRELPIAIDKYPTSRYSLVVCHPRTGRKHQIRRHLKHINHPIIGDAKHGKSLHNHFFRETLAVNRLLLANTELIFPHPCSQQPLHLRARLDATFSRLLTRLDWVDAVPPEWLESS